MTEYRLPEGMTAEWMREHADWLTASDDQATTHDVADDLRAWADAIDPPKSIVTDEMVEAVHLSLFDGSDWEAEVRRVLEAAERLGWLRDLESDADNPSSNDEQALAAAKALCDSVEMAEDLLRRAMVGAPRGLYGYDGDDEGYYIQHFGELVLERAEAEYLRSLTGEGDSDE